MIAGISILALTPFFDFSWPSDYRVYVLLCVASIFYAIADRLNTTVRSGIEASTFSVINQLSTVFMILAGFLILKEEFIFTKIIGSFLIIFSNIIVFYNKKNIHLLFDFFLFLLIPLHIDTNLPHFLIRIFLFFLSSKLFARSKS
jgi:drug/metabolite transporter (DMT)-like permease